MHVVKKVNYDNKTRSYCPDNQIEGWVALLVLPCDSKHNPWRPLLHSQSGLGFYS